MNLILSVKSLNLIIDMVAKLFKVVFGKPGDSEPTQVFVAATDSATAFDYANSRVPEDKEFLGIFCVSEVLIPGTITDFE